METFELIKTLENTLNDKPGRNEKIVSLLQEIGAELLKKYEIRVKNITIEPLRVEPYLYKEIVFEDKFIHSENGVYGPHQRKFWKAIYP